MLLFCTLGVTDIQPAIASSGRSDSKKALRKSCAPCQSLRQQTLTIWCGMKTGRVMWPDVSWGSAGHSRQTMRTWKTWRTCQPSPPQGHLHATWVPSRAGISSEWFEYASMDMQRLFPGWMSSDARNYIHPGQSTNVACLPLLPRTTLPKTRIEADGTVSLCSSSSLMRSRYERVRGERERESVHFQTKTSYRKSSCWSTTCLKRGRTESFGFWCIQASNTSDTLVLSGLCRSDHGKTWSGCFQNIMLLGGFFQQQSNSWMKWHGLWMLQLP